MAVSLMDNLNNFGVDVDIVLNRFLNNEELYKKFLFKFPDQINIEDLRDKIYNEQYEELISIAHVLKGVTGNLGLTPLYNCFTEMVCDLRNEEYDNIQTLYEKIVDYYEELNEMLVICHE